MNVNKIIARNINTRITHLLDSGEVVQGIYKDGKPISFTTAPLTKQQFHDVLPNAKQIKVITRELEQGIYQRLVDIFTVEQNKGKLIKKIIYNYKNGSATYITKILDEAKQLQEKYVAKYKNVLLLPQIPTKRDFDLFAEAMADAENIFVTSFKDGKIDYALTNIKSEREFADGTPLKYFVKNQKLTKYGKLVKTYAEKKKSIKNIEPIDWSQTSDNKPSVATIVTRPFNDEELLRVCLKRGFIPQVETLPINKATFQYRNKCLSETREIFSLPFQDSLRSKLFDILTFTKNNDKIKVIKNYKKQETRILWSNFDESGQLTRKTVYYLNPNNNYELNKLGITNFNDLHSFLQDNITCKITDFRGGKAIKVSYKNKM